MATKSVLKSVEIKSKEAAHSLIVALENAEGKHAKPVVVQRSFSNASREELRKMFGARE